MVVGLFETLHSVQTDIEKSTTVLESMSITSAVIVAGLYETSHSVQTLKEV